MIVSRFKVSGRGIVPIGKAAALAMVTSAVLLASAGVQASEPLVGEVSLLIGSARVVHKNGSSEPLRRGSRIAVGDRVETTANGHVHVRFIDNASVSVRPDSVLEVQAYRFDASNPQSNEVRLSVEQGMSRSISGQATEVDKNRFRLNTPLAAIGVRGTDFLVQATDSGVRASVADGAIVVGALGAGCSASGLGPCSGSRTSELSAGMGRLMVEVRRGEEVARLVPLSGTLLAAASASSEERLVAQRAAESASRTGSMLAAELTYHNPNDRTAADAITIAQTFLPDLNSAPDSKAQLVWGRYSPVVPQNDSVSIPYAQARIGRDFTVGDGDYTLWRKTDPANPEGMLQSTEVKASFQLSRGQATFVVGGKAEPASIDGGTLTLDFARRTFATALALSAGKNDSLIKTELRVAGDVLPNGTFGAKELDASQKLTGAVSLDGKEAGYLFERSTSGGLFKGKTLWGR